MITRRYAGAGYQARSCIRITRRTLGGNSLATRTDRGPSNGPPAAAAAAAAAMRRNGVRRDAMTPAP
eukprot:scaffold5135_cov113-Isochrysis_galbana.AAC.10